MLIDQVFGEFPVIESEQVTLGRILDIHWQDVYEIYSNANVFRYCGILTKNNIATVKNMIGHFERDFRKRSRIKWGIFRKEEPQVLVGIIEAMDFNQRLDMVTIGYFLGEPYWGQGTATAAAKALIRFLIEDAGVNRIQAEVMPENEPSKKVLAKCGFTREGLLRQATFWSGKGIIDIEIYSLLREEY